MSTNTHVTRADLQQLERFSFGRHHMARHDARHIDLAFVGDVSAEDIAQLLPRLDAWGMDNRHMVIELRVDQLGRFDATARRRMAQYRFANQDAVETLILVVGANVIQRAIMTLVVTASRLTTQAKVTSEFIDSGDEAARRALEYLAAHPE